MGNSQRQPNSPGFLGWIYKSIAMGPVDKTTWAAGPVFVRDAQAPSPDDKSGVHGRVQFWNQESPQQPIFDISAGIFEYGSGAKSLSGEAEMAVFTEPKAPLTLTVSGNFEHVNNNDPKLNYGAGFKASYPTSVLRFSVAYSYNVSNTQGRKLHTLSMSLGG